MATKPDILRPPEPAQRPFTTAVMKTMCPGCPFDWGKPMTEEAFNLGCLPGQAEIMELCERTHTVWACHSAPDLICCGFADVGEVAPEAGLCHLEGVHDTSAETTLSDALRLAEMEGRELLRDFAIARRAID